MNEKSAKNVTGFLLYNPYEEKHFFRVYGEKNPETGRKEYTDYRLSAEDIEVTIKSDDLSLYESEDDEKNRLDWMSRITTTVGPAKLKPTLPKDRQII